MTSFAEFTKGLQTSSTVTAAKFKKNIIQKSKDDFNEETDSYENDSYSTDCSDEKSKDVERIEEPWTKKIEELIEKWNKDIKKNQKMHDKSGYYYKKLRQKWGLPSILLPVTMAPISAVFAETNWIKYVNMVSFVSVALLSGVDSFFSFASRKEKHFNHSCRYAELSTFIDSELFKKKAFRIQADVFLTEVRMKLDTLTTTAPTIPQFILTHQMNTEKFAEIVEIV